MSGSITSTAAAMTSAIASNTAGTPTARVRGWMRTWRGPMTLRRRLVLSIVALAVGLSLVIGFVSVIVLRGVLLTQLDGQVSSSLSRATSPGGESPTGTVPGDVDGVRGQSEGTVTVISIGNSVVASQNILRDGSAGSVSASVERALEAVAADRKTSSVNLGGTYGGYRVMATSFPATLKSTGRSVTVHIAVGLPLTSVNGPVTKLIAAIAVIAAAGVAVSILFALLTVDYALRPLRRIAATASRVAEMPLDRGDVALDARVVVEDVEGRTEVGRVGLAMNRMLGHVSHALTARQESENKVRQFVADASHELRTPLASVRGYAELTRRMNQDLPADVVYAMGRIESESVRMTSLVEELLLLARLDEGTDLVVKDVDLTRTVVDAVHDAAVSTSTHSFDVVVAEDEPVVVAGDAMRLHQVVANLLTNAKTHTPEGTHVDVTLALDRSSQEAVITVADNGPGIDPSVRPVLFERFARADSSRSRKAGSTGLGLAIVEAVVHSHRGTVDVGDNEPGAVFTVRLPLYTVPSPEALVRPAPLAVDA